MLRDLTVCAGCLVLGSAVTVWYMGGMPMVIERYIPTSEYVIRYECLQPGHNPRPTKAQDRIGG